MGHTVKAALSTHHSSAMFSHSSRPAHSSTASSKGVNSHVPLSPFSATHSTFHRPTFTSTTAHCPARNPLTPSYSLPTYPICTPPTPAFVHSSLDVSDISSTPAQRHPATHTKDHISVHDIEGAQPMRLRQNQRAISQSQNRQSDANEPTGLLRYLRPAPVDMLVVDQPEDATQPFTSHFTSSFNTSPAAPGTPPSRPRSSPPTTTTSTTAVPQPAAYRSPYTRFSHSPHVLTPPTVPFASLYHTAVPSTDPLPAFRCTIQRPLALPSNCAPLGGVVDGLQLEEAGCGGGRRKWRRSGGSSGRRMKGVSARVQCWRASGGEVERSTGVVFGGGGGDWQRIRVQDIELVSSLTL